MFQPTKEWVNKVNLSSLELENFFQICACVISARKAKQLDATTMFTYSDANTPLGQSERAYYLGYFIKPSSSSTNQNAALIIDHWILLKYHKLPLISNGLRKGALRGLMIKGRPYIRRGHTRFNRIYSQLEKSCRKKCTRQPSKVLWVVFSSLFFKEI